MLGIVKIQGQSMEPVLSGGDFVITSRYFHKLSINDLIIFTHPVYGQLIKRISSIDSHDNFWVSGENDMSLTSDQMGIITRQAIQAKILFCIKKKRKV